MPRKVSWDCSRRGEEENKEHIHHSPEKSHDGFHLFDPWSAEVAHDQDSRALERNLDEKPMVSWWPSLRWTFVFCQSLTLLSATRAVAIDRQVWSARPN